MTGTGTSSGGLLPAVRQLIAGWPWIPAALAAALVNLAVGASRDFDYGGINGFSTTNFGWLAFALVGGCVFAWRPARPPLEKRAALRPVLATAMAYALCFAAVMVSGLVFLPDQSLTETLTTDAPGRALPVALAVLGFGVLATIFRAGARRPL
ncbi:MULTISPECIES: hypothetical protein [unclassified Streptomyces]|uniref:hypothetical protein n=1 Tax=unclassified Streptomyces TaxID=2593676 RepID=UPI00278BCBE6|nr:MULTISPECIES: hypothetical protein [unclassified Streptomyces]